MSCVRLLAVPKYGLGKRSRWDESVEMSEVGLPFQTLLSFLREWSQGHTSHSVMVSMVDKFGLSHRGCVADPTGILRHRAAIHKQTTAG